MSPPSSNVTYTVPVQSAATAVTAAENGSCSSNTSHDVQRSAAVINNGTTASSTAATAVTKSRVGDAAILQQSPTTAATPAAAYASDTYTEVPLKGREEDVEVQSVEVEVEVARHIIIPPAVRYFVHQAEEWHSCDAPFATMPSQRCDIAVTLAAAGVLLVNTAAAAAAAAVQASSSNSEAQQHSVNGATSSSFADGQSATAAGAATESYTAVASTDTAVNGTAGATATADATAVIDDGNSASNGTAAAAVSDVQLNGVQNADKMKGSNNSVSTSSLHDTIATLGYDELIVNVLKDRDGAGNSRWAAMTKVRRTFLSIIYVYFMILQL
jgi:hypothetical protein